ncbi:MAG: alpha/beta hydrolase, partial [Pseudomonadota bacterium]
QHEADVVLPKVLDAAGIEKALFMGHSDGGTIALMYASKNPGRTIGCIVEAPHVKVEEVTVKGIRRAGRAFSSGDLKRGLAKYHADPDGIFNRWYQTWTHPNFAAWNMLNRLPHIACPVLGIQGKEDQYGSFSQLTTIRDSIAGQAMMQGLKNCGHTPHGERPELVIDSIMKFLPICR